MKLIIIILLSIISQIGNAQEYKKINSSKLIYKSNGFFAKNSVSITNKDGSKLPMGFYETKIEKEKVPIQFYISSKGNVDGLFIIYYYNKSFCKTILKEGAWQSDVYFDSAGKTMDSLHIKNKNIETYNDMLKKWETKSQLVSVHYYFDEKGQIFKEKGKIYKETYQGLKHDLKIYDYYENGALETDETCFYYRKEYDSLGVLTQQIDYNWKTREIQTLGYENGKLAIKKVEFDEDQIWNPDGTINKSKKTHKRNHISKSYIIETEYYPSGKIYRYKKNGESKEYTEDGKEVIYSQTVKGDPEMDNETEPTADEDLENKVYQSGALEIKPEYPNGIDALYKFFHDNFIMPEEEGLQGTVYLSFIVEKDGSLSDIKILRDIGYSTGQESVRVLRKSEKWIPGEQKGKKVRCLYTLPIKLPLQSK
ncbi:energy transducer TonB [Flavobacterium sp. MMLR14_040]|uniref:energy transducer TonB n=1 Tax=Flavobacterium sp. MMLR14_040 TaxID=3093843 RepID=UPI002990003E|nr:energy transducer TonB [Flavobacterium sp. MMLR14_040]MDW8850057.1 energy transducer TonB [Flavobacterium sp. MMLR14_040]